MWALVSDYIGTLLNVLSVLLFARLVLKEKSNISKWKLVLLVLFIALGLQLFCYLNLTTVKTFVFFLIFAFLFKKIYSFDMGKAIILDFFYFIVMILSDMITSRSLTLILGEEIFYNSLAGGILANLMVFVILMFITLCFRKIIYRFLNVKVKYKMIFLLIISLLCIISIFYSTFRLGTNSADNVLCFFSIVVIVLVLCYSFMQVYNNNQLTSEYDNLLSFIKKYEVEINNQRMLRHETKNQLLTIKSKIIDKEKNSEIISYIDEIINDDRKVNHSDYAKLKYLPSNGIKGLFYFKLSLAQDKGIKIGVSISKIIENSFLNDLDSFNFNQIGKVLGVYLDNAIEAASESKNKVIGIEAFQDDDKIIFVISNSYNANQKMIGRTSKGPGRGYGLLLVNNIISNNNKLSSSTEIMDDLYVKKLIIKK